MSDVPTLPPPQDLERAQTPRAPAPRRYRRWITLAVVIAVASGLIVIGIAVAGSGSTPAATQAAGTSVAPVIEAPIALRAHAASFKVVLTWRRGAGDVPVTSYEISRDGTYLKNVGSDADRFVDDSVLPTVTYHYEVVGIADADRSAPAAVRVTTPKAPLGVARLSGVFNVRLVKTSSYGVNGIPTKTTAGWRFTPKCDEGACDTTWIDIHWKALSSTLKRTGSSYAVTTSVHGFLECSGTPSASSYTLKIHATKAQTVKDAWRVTAFEGTATVYDAAQLGCRSSNIVYSVSGTLPH